MTFDKNWKRLEYLHKYVRLLAVSIFTLSISLPAMAEDDQDQAGAEGSDSGETAGVLEEVIVTSARRREENVQDVPIAVKQTRRHAEKVRIARAAVEMIEDGETIILDSGSTTLEIARQLRSLEVDSLSVITNALNIAMEIAALRGIATLDAPLFAEARQQLML